MNSALFLALRRMRAPLIVLIVAYAVSILGMVLIPGVDGQGMPWRVSFFHAFYFVSYTATTIGFGEIPYAFTDAQRMWVTATIYITVVAWFYALGKILQIMQDPAFQHVLAAGRFGRAVHGLREPFFIVCGFGETGGELVEAFDHRGVRAVVVDLSPARVGEVELVDLLLDVPALVGDVRTPETLVLAGLRHPKCAGLVALTNDDQANLAVAATARLLRPGLPVVCRCESEQTAKSMAAFGVDQVIDPFALFGVHLATALRKPGHFLLREWLTAAPDELSREPLFPPTGRWVLCGFGRFGTRTAMGLELAGNTVTIIDSDPEVAAASGLLCGHGTERDTLERAGIRDAVGLIAGTADDVTNLSIVQIGRQIRRDLFVVARQNQRRNGVLFEAAGGTVTVQPTMVVVHECLAYLMSPLLGRFLASVADQPNEWANELIARIAAVMEERVPESWAIRLDAHEAPAIVEALASRTLTLAVLLADPQRRSEDLPVVPLAIERGDGLIVLPGPDAALERGDRLLFCGRGRGRRKQFLTIADANVLRYVATGQDVPGGWIWSRFARSGEA
jgi:voltage-gated potassium channel